MANMSYCRFENTVRDMHDCYNAMEDVECLRQMRLSDTERRAFQEMFNLMEDMVERMNELVIADDEISTDNNGLADDY